MSHDKETADPDPHTNDDDLVLLITTRARINQLAAAVRCAYRESYLDLDDHDTILEYLADAMPLPDWLNDR